MTNSNCILQALWVAFVLVALATSAPAQSQMAAPAGAPRALPKDEVLQQVTALSRTGANHQLLADMVGEWTYTGQHISPDATKKPFEFKGSVTKRALWNGRFVVSETVGGQMPMLWAEGKTAAYNDLMVEGYDNVAQKFVATTINNENDTGIVLLEGLYDPGTRTITYEGETTAHLHRNIAPGTRMRLRGLVKFLDTNHYVLDWHESIDGKEIVNTVITYTRVPAK